jgi:ABC-type branched-subunit amino acid transport system ATPase component
MNAPIHTEKLVRRFGRTTAVDSVGLDVPQGAVSTPLTQKQIFSLNRR